MYFSSIAGSLFDSDLVLAELPTVLTGAISLIVLKAIPVAAATRVPRWLEPNRLEAYDAVKLSFLLAGVSCDAMKALCPLCISCLLASLWTGRRVCLCGPSTS